MPRFIPQSVHVRAGRVRVPGIEACAGLIVLTALLPVAARGQDPEVPIIDIEVPERQPPAAKADEASGRAPPAGLDEPDPGTEGVDEPTPAPPPEAPAPVTPPEHGPSAPPRTMRDWMRAGHPIGGFYLSQGPGWSQWRYGDQRQSTLSYRLEVGGGLGGKVAAFYVSVATLLGGKLYDGAVKANYTRVGFLLSLAGGRWFRLLFGPGAALVTLTAARWKDSKLFDVGFALPVKMVISLPLPRYWSLGVGVSYDFNYVPIKVEASGNRGYLLHVWTTEFTVARW